jgi:hypothetical protein
MRFPGWMLWASLSLTGAAWCQEVRPGGVIVFPKSAQLGKDPPIQYLQEFASVYQALKAGQMPPRLGPHFITARGLLADPNGCTDVRGIGPLVELGNSMSRALGQTERTRQVASDRAIVLTSTARYACPDEVAVDGKQGVSRVPGYEGMARVKGTFIETIAPRKMAVLPGVTAEQAAAFQKFGDMTQRRSDSGAVPAPGSMADLYAQLEEIRKLPPEQQKKAVEEANARAKADRKGRQAAQAQADEISKPLMGAFSRSGVQAAQEKALSFLEMLQPGEAYVDLYKYYGRDGDSFGALHYLGVVSGAAGSRMIRLGAAEPIDAAIAGYIGNAHDRKVFESSWKELQRLLAQPLLAALPAGTTSIWVSPDSELFNVPFASLLFEQKAELSVAVVPSAYDFSRLQSTTAALPTAKALLVGDLVETTVPLADIATGFDAQKFQVQKLAGPQATLPAVMTNMKDAQFILFSTHGRWANGGATTDEAFASAGIELYADAAGAPGSVLTGADVARVELPQTDLVVLLACETAQGQAVNGQGSLGFQSAFMAAGARSLLVALWKVPADASKELIQHFHDGLFKRGLSRAEALKQAQAALRGQERYADPWNWGGWILLGDPRPIVH